jgi:hypothetical protein
VSQATITMSNTFAALQDSDSESDVSDVEMPAAPVRKKPKAKHAPPQSGGSFAERRDPLTGVSMGNSTDANPLEFDPLDVEACLRVVTAVGANINLFKLPQLKPLRAALHPLILEQMKNYDPQSLNEKGSDRSKRNRNSKRKGGGGSGPDVYEDLQKLQKQKLATLEEEYINQVDTSLPNTKTHSHSCACSVRGLVTHVSCWIGRIVSIYAIN